MPAPAFSSRFKLDEDTKDKAKEAGADQLKEALAEKIAEQVDHALALSSEPFSFVVSILNHVSEAAEVVKATQRLGGKAVVVIPLAAKQQEDDLDRELFT